MLYKFHILPYFIRSFMVLINSKIGKIGTHLVLTFKVRQITLLR